MDKPCIFVSYPNQVTCLLIFPNKDIQSKYQISKVSGTIMKKKIMITAALITLQLSLLFSTELTNLISTELQTMYNSNFELSIGSNTCNVGTFTWEESGVGTSFSSYLQKNVQDAIVDTKSFDLILSDVQPVFGPEASEILSQNKEMKLGHSLYLVLIAWKDHLLN